MTITATYDPADDKLRLQASTRLDKELYLRVKAAGFGWAPKQDCFYAVWSPRREDLALELAGEIGDEDTTLVDRAEQRAERFEGYQENRAADAEQAHAAVSRIADGIPLGQPILVGHHSQRHARKDAERIENGMRKAVKMWDTAQYWKSRAVGALAHARYLERPDVRARRIKTIEAEIRSLIADYTPHTDTRPIIQGRSYYGGFRYQCNTCDPAHYQIGFKHEMACSKCGGREWTEAREEVSHVWVGPKGRGGRWVAEDSLERIKAGNQRSLAHLRNRLEYEAAMLGEAGGLTAEKFAIEVGGQVKRRGEWFVVTGLNKRDGALLSVSVVGHWAGTIQAEDIQDYKAAPEGAAEQVKAAMKLKPLVNFRAAGCVEMTMAEWKQKTKWSDSYFAANYDVEGNHTYGRVKDGEKPIAYRQRSLNGKDWKRVPVFILDAPVKEPPKVVVERPKLPARELPEVHRPTYQAPEPTKFDALKETLKAGVQVVSAPQLFATPVSLACTMAALAKLNPGDRVLEPSAGTGRIAEAIRAEGAEPVMVEINQTLCDNLARRFKPESVVCGDFMEQNGNLGKFDAVLMNPPFANADDIKHILHARKFLKPGGHLVAICANGPRQREALMDLADHWKDLPAGTFAESGTNVNTALLVIRAGVSQPLSEAHEPANTGITA